LIRIEDSRATTPVRRGVEKNCTDSPVWENECLALIWLIK
jgi:hypothetical protein